MAENSVAIVESVVKLGHAMGLMVTAEGVETPGQMSALADAGCNQLQGLSVQSGGARRSALSH
ncbi:cyclic-di-GMP phosphodiesterase [Pantoea agglomerans]|uniref:Cyclic-di-GMP phosphodiesterase n=1 Tax=Enterobacter agglomerans TaxID=549 RepID=A0A379AE60_ENTAG|nr:cyclic-di-GMP phosphodiesterase [Pantoea agglomerans]